MRRLMTYNIHGCIGSNGRYDADAILRVIEQSKADIVALQEVYNETAEERSFFQRVHDLSYPHFVYGETLQHPTRGSYGNLLLSKWPLRKVERIDLSISNYEPRGAIHAEVKLPEGSIDVTATHFGLRQKERVQQMAKLVAHWELPSLLDRPKRAFCLLGDLNEWRPGGPLLGALRHLIADSPRLRTFPTRAPAFALDRIVLRPRRLIQNLFVYKTSETRRASDHFPMIADIDLEAKPRQII